jgi:hypothetical protein
MARRSTIKGAASFRRLLKALPDSANKQLVSFLQTAGPVLAAKMRSEIPVLSAPRPNRTPGLARNSISWRVTPVTLNLKVGELTKKDIVFYAHILDVGRKGKTVPIKRGPRAGHKMNVRAMAPLYIVTSVRAAYRLDSLPGYRTLMDQILLDASQGVGDD